MVVEPQPHNHLYQEFDYIISHVPGNHHGYEDSALLQVERRPTAHFYSTRFAISDGTRPLYDGQESFSFSGRSRQHPRGRPLVPASLPKTNHRIGVPKGKLP